MPALQSMSRPLLSHKPHPALVVERPVEQRTGLLLFGYRVENDAGEPIAAGSITMRKVWASPHVDGMGGAPLAAQAAIGVAARVLVGQWLDTLVNERAGRDRLDQLALLLRHRRSDIKKLEEEIQQLDAEQAGLLILQP